MRRSRSLLLSAALLAALPIASGCGAQRAYALLDPAVAAVDASAIQGERTVFVATTRAKSAEPGHFFDGTRAPSENFARVEVTVPGVHKPGALERPRRGPQDAAKHFVARDVVVYDSGKDFVDAMRPQIAARGGRAMVFVHGYNTRFGEAVYRVSQIAHDADYSGAVVLFTWASAGRTLDYVYDQNSASVARDSLEETLRMLARSGARRIDVIAHSMGNWVTLEALRQLAMTGDRDLGRRLGDVVLAAPDVDVDVFKTQMRHYGKPDKPFFVLVSGDDRALEASRLIAGNRPRLGDDYAEAREIAESGVNVVDITNASGGDSLNHAKFADNPVLVKLLGDRLREDDSLGTDERGVEDRLDGLVRGVGQTIGTAAEIVITTPVEVLSVVVGQ